MFSFDGIYGKWCQQSDQHAKGHCNYFLQHRKHCLRSQQKPHTLQEQPYHKVGGDIAAFGSSIWVSCLPIDTFQLANILFCTVANPCIIHKGRVTRIDSSMREKDQRVLVDRKLNMSQQCDEAAKNNNNSCEPRLQ